MVGDDITHRERKKLRSKISRRDILKASGTATGVAMLGVGSVQAHRYGDEGNDVDEVDIEATDVTVTECTDSAVTASPDGESIVMELQGVLFRLAGAGGHAEPLTDVTLEPARPDYAPDGTRIAFQAYAAGNWDIWTMAPDGSDLRQLTDDFWDDREPRWSPNGCEIAVSSDRGEGYDIWTLDVATGDLQQWTDDTSENAGPTWSPDGTEIAYVSGHNRNKIKAVNQDGDTRTLVSAETGSAFHSPSWSPDGKNIAYIRERECDEQINQIDLMVSEEQITDGEDVFIYTPDWLSADTLLYTADGDIQVFELESGEASDVPFSATFGLPEIDYNHKSYDFDDRGTREVLGIMTPALNPDGEHVAFVALNDLWVMRIGESPHRITDDSAYQTDPAWSPDGRYLVYSSDKSGTADLYVHDMQTGIDQRVTSRDEGATLSASWSPDGTEIAFQNQNGATFTVGIDSSEGAVETGETRQIVDSLFAPGNPTWSEDGSILAMAALYTYSDRSDVGTNQILTVDIETGKKQYYPPGSTFESISTRAQDGPVWSPDGHWMAFVVDSTLRVMPVTETGKPDGPAKQITDEAAHSLAWSGDSGWLLYLHHGQLKKVRRDGSKTQEVPLNLDYQPGRPTGRKVIYVGRMWDGVSSEIHENVTIEIINNRIKRITANSQPPDGPYVDASALTVIPGLWDSHVHQTMTAGAIGDRQGRLNLAYGVTTTVSRGDLVYRSLEQREALESGTRVGARYFASGELIDGSRISYRDMRSVTSIEQAQLEMERAIELDYDFVKTYERLSAELMAEVTDITHAELGVPVASHFLAPGSFVGQDGTTHLPYNRARSSMIRQIYDDVIKLYGQGERWVNTTLFTSEFFLVDEIQSDPRTQLFPPWTRKELLDDVANNTEYPSDPECNTELCRNATTLKRILDNGGLVLAGTDAPLDYIGLGMHGNLRTLVEYGGFSPHEALLTATRFAAEHQGVEDDLGTLEPGKLADMVFVEGNPLEQIEDMIQVRMTMKNGELYTIEDLVEPFEVAETDDDDANI